jgi:hypothetical protein
MPAVGAPDEEAQLPEPETKKLEDAGMGGGPRAEGTSIAPNKPGSHRPKADEDGVPGAARPLAAVAEASGERISRDVLVRAVDANLQAFRRCATSDAKVRVRLSLSGGGSVTKVEALRSQPDDARLRDCVVEVLRGLSFPRGAGSDASTAEFDLVLSKPDF